MRSAPVLVLPLFVAACTGIIGGGEDDSTGSSGRGAADAPSVNGQIVVTPQVVRVTSLAYTNSVRDLFPGVTIPALTLPTAPTSVVYDNNAVAQAPTATLIQAYQANGQTIANAVVANLGKVLPCSSSAVDDACATTYLVDLSSRAYRHPLRDDERARLTTAWQSLRAVNDVPTSIGAVIEGILQAPSFLYQIEEGAPVEGNLNVARLTGNELATRLATLFWASIPDAPLRAVGDDDRILDPDELDAQARRLLDDPRAHESVAHMQYQWLRFSLLEKIKKDTTLFPTWSDTTAATMREATVRFADHVFWEEGNFAALFTDNHAFVNDLIAPYYGLNGGGGAALTMMTVPSSQRSGLLTQVGLLSAFGHETMESPVLRGVFVLDRLLCSPPPPPPPDVKNTPPAATNVETTTTRERFQALHEQGSCAGCHKLIDGVGFGFEHFDAVGKWRDVEGGKPVDATGTLAGTGDVDGPFVGVGELSAKIARSQRSSFCITRNWMQYALGIDASAATEELVKPLQADLGATPAFRNLLLAIVKSSAFRYRTVTP